MSLRLLSVFALVAVLVLSGCLFEGSPPQGDFQITLVLNYTDPATGQRVYNATDAWVKNGSTVFDALNKTFRVEYSTHPIYGVFVEGINGVMNTQSVYWFYFVNGRHADVGVSSYVLTEPAVFEFRFEPDTYYSS